MKRLCTICARGGSKGVKNKNLLPFLGKPLIAHSISQALRSELFAVVAVSSDSEDILGVAKEYGAQIVVKRPDELATDSAAKIPVIQHLTREVEKRLKLKFETVVDLDASAPLRTIKDIVTCVQLVEKEKATNVITATPARKSPYFNLIEFEGQTPHVCKALPKPVQRRQDAPLCYDMNASIYVWQRDILLTQATLFLDKTRLHVMSEVSAIDIDTEIDYAIVNFLVQAGIYQEGTHAKIQTSTRHRLK